jgi:hypothetical protein
MIPMIITAIAIVIIVPVSTIVPRIPMCQIVNLHTLFL